jgi:ABC-type transport system involved in multi-copper enzyme maturation permease subunit
MEQIFNQTAITVRRIVRDRLLHAVLGVALLLILLVPLFSVFSMRQVQELAVTLSLAAIALTLLVLALLLGSSSVWRDVERRYTAAVLSLPISRSAYLLGRFLGIALFIVTSGVILGLVAVPVIILSAAQYPSAIPLHWATYGAAVAASILKGVLLTAVAFLFSSLSTSFYLPFFATAGLYLAGSASQEVYEFVTGKFGATMNPVSLALVKGAYYIVPNFSAFNLQTQAIYGLPLSGAGLFLAFAYFLVYTAILLSVSVRVFASRELP